MQNCLIAAGLKPDAVSAKPSAELSALRKIRRRTTGNFIPARGLKDDPEATRFFLERIRSLEVRIVDLEKQLRHRRFLEKSCGFSWRSIEALRKNVEGLIAVKTPEDALRELT